jgi:hypothetical protein
VSSNGNVSLTGVIAGANGSVGIGVNANANGTVTLTCSDASDNVLGLSVSAYNGSDPITKLILKGFLSYGNTNPDSILAISTVSTACPTG